MRSFLLRNEVESDNSWSQARFHDKISCALQVGTGARAKAIAWKSTRWSVKQQRDHSSHRPIFLPCNRAYLIRRRLIISLAMFVCLSMHIPISYNESCFLFFFGPSVRASADQVDQPAEAIRLQEAARPMVPIRVPRPYLFHFTGACLYTQDVATQRRCLLSPIVSGLATTADGRASVWRIVRCKRCSIALGSSTLLRKIARRWGC
ncbi:hypothetical protein K437DRAFT_36672 [Tilletiaria anomala UBC 951]|uniref:Uncharacterized protein n=1 Tax=Tilletiaria anomala (strain ATCC 24038 / CBS 436.72 / UBC 951) TaxID=1037660 RepID=A0A066V836_TILAU|nr:uncharacterized protein K437DRAFT_36672 [Tilletiaria anomala UBC 951]KDN37656.1 hypothetical protein K437DRAFT_36672 [Tilletiaria anomala UBC 951]